MAITAATGPTMFTLRRIAKEQNINGRWSMDKATLEKVTGYNRPVPEHVPFMELLALDYEHYARIQADIVRNLEQQLDAYTYESAHVDQLRDWLRTARMDLAEARETAAHYRRQAAR